MDHVIVCGLHTLGLRIVEVLRSSDVPVLVVDDDPDPKLLPILDRWAVPYIPHIPRLPDVLRSAGIQTARAVVSVEADDLQNLETALVVRSLRPDIRIILQMANTAVGSALADLVSSGAALDVAGLAAPSLVQACLGGVALNLELGGDSFAVTETLVTRPGTLRSIYGDLVPIGVVGTGSAVEICPGRDHPVRPGDRVTVLGTSEDLTETLEGHRATIADSGGRLTRADTVVQAMRSVAQGAGRRVGALLGALVVLVALSTVILHLGYVTSPGHHLPILDSLYFTVETISTVGYGDFSFAHQATWLLIFGIALIILGATAITAMFALVTDLLLSRRVADAFGLRRVTRMHGHVVVIGLGTVGLRVVEELMRYRLPVVVIESDEQNRHLHLARALHVPVVVGDATRAATLTTANVASASAVAILTSDDLTNLETGLSLREFLRRTRRGHPRHDADLRPPARSSHRGGLRVPAGSLDVCACRPVVRGGCPWPRHPLDLLRRAGAAPRRQFDRRSLRWIGRARHAGAVRPYSGHRHPARRRHDARTPTTALDPLRPRRSGVSHRSLRRAARGTAA